MELLSFVNFVFFSKAGLDDGFSFSQPTVPALWLQVSRMWLQLSSLQFISLLPNVRDREND